MTTKGIDADGVVFHFPIDLTVEEAEIRIRSSYGLENGGIEEDGVPVLGTLSIGSLTGSLAFVGGSLTGVGGSTGYLRSISMYEEIMKHRAHPSVPFTTILDSHLPFKIPVINPEYVTAFPLVFELGRAEYQTAVDQWVSEFAVSLGLTSESAVVANDFLWQGILGTLCNLTIHLNESSHVNFTGLFNNILVIKGEARADSSAISIAISELIDKFHSTAHLMFPSHCPIIPGVVSSRQLISLHRIYFDSISQRFCQDPVKQYRILARDDRVRFIQDIFKIAIWIVSQTSPSQYFHLVTNVRIETRNKHHVTLEKEGILKEFHQRGGRQIPMDIIRAVYGPKLPNVEQGTVNCTSVTITTVGRRLRDAIRLGIVDSRLIFEQVQAAVRQLHEIGIAHCDICADNIFVNMVDNNVFLGDLEYCQPMKNPPPVDICRSDSKAMTAEELDFIQLEKFRRELTHLLL